MAINVREVLGAEADALLKYESKTVSRSSLYLPGPDFIDRVVSQSDRSPWSCATTRRS
jgi:class I fructose-bisphosphate aldolase